MSGAACSSFCNLFGPPQVTIQESYRENPDGLKFDHSLLDEVLRKHVDEDGWVDYDKLGKDSQKLDRYIEAVRQANFAEMGRSEKLALLINAYNAFTLRLILDYYPLNSIMDITRAGGSLGIPGLYVTGDPGAVDDNAKIGMLGIRIGLGWAKSHNFTTGQCPVMRYHRQLMQAILYDKIQIARATNVTVIGLDDAPQGYKDFDKGAAKKFVLDPHGVLAA